MKNMGMVQGSLSQAQPLIVGLDTVYVHTDIIKLNIDAMGNTVGNLYQYNEIQYTKNEYIELQGRLLNKQKSDIDFIAITMGVDLDV